MKKPSGFIKERVENVKNSTKKIVGTEDIKKNFEYIKETSKVLITPDKSDKSNKNITYNEMLEKNNLTLIEIQKIYKNSMISSYIFSIGAVVCLLLGIYAFSYPHKFDIILQLVPCLAVMSLMVVLSLKSSMTCYQINHKILINFKDFISTYEFFPSIKPKDIEK